MVRRPPPTDEPSTRISVQSTSRRSLLRENMSHHGTSSSPMTKCIGSWSSRGSRRCQAVGASNLSAFLPKASLPSCTTTHRPPKPASQPMPACLSPMSQLPASGLASTDSCGHKAQAASPATVPAQVSVVGMIRCSASMKVMDTSSATSSQRKMTTCGACGAKIHQTAANNTAVRSSTPK